MPPRALAPRVRGAAQESSHKWPVPHSSLPSLWAVPEMAAHCLPMTTCKQSYSVPCVFMAKVATATRMCAWALPAALTLSCLLYTSDAADDLLCVDLGGR